jgi:hypothetical protein
VRWPSGFSQKFQNVPADAIYEIDEGQGIRKLKDFQLVPDELPGQDAE